MNASELTSAHWRKSSRSSNTSSCVEVASNLLGEHGLLYIRDSKHPAGPALAFASDEWDAFLDGAKRGDFDL